MHKEALASGLGDLEAPGWMRALRYLWVYPAHNSTWVIAAESHVSEASKAARKIAPGSTSNDTRSSGFVDRHEW